MPQGAADADARPSAQENAATTYIPVPMLPVDLKDSASHDGRDWNAKALEALAKQLSASNDFYHPLLAVAQELRDFPMVRATLIELLRTFNPNSKP